MSTTVTDSTLPELPAAEIARLDALFPARRVAVGEGVWVSVRECGNAAADTLPLVCLHGIGSGSASWLESAQLLAPRTRLIAWDAPGYGESTPLPQAQPTGADYAQRVHALLDALQITRCVLVGHSLGALMAAPAARSDERIAALVLISPAQGYGAEGREAERARVHAERMGSLAELGIAGMAARRSGRLVSEHASPVARAWVRWNMARLHEGGYRQAIELLCGGRLLADVAALPPGLPLMVACGELDVVTPPAACVQVAQQRGVPLVPIAHAGHASYVEQPAAVAALLTEVLKRASV
ncbi:alpha/beta hydrolase [Xenophilus arseniciresistens]|uniref:Alpha/beta hydrolase n=1 Tax=Xenophilus arseniciresistens TaxID=1283306 RepID=A0AAE3N7B9_9BURK|nr:alpha/beta hydrolase [Xenophilus arseniciresistens]MDA7417330.1 alpha/beta hydrolase [Xenophilus arseniciresistens]